MASEQNTIIHSNGGAGQGATQHSTTSNINIIQENMTECPVCMEDFDESKINYVLCGCNHKVCFSCCKTYIETSSKPPNCMHCKIEWDRTFLYNVFPSSYVNKTLRMHRKKILFEMEKAKMPETQHYVHIYKKLQNIYRMQRTFKNLEIKYKGAGITKGELITNQFLHTHPEIIDFYPDYYDDIIKNEGKHLRLYKILQILSENFNHNLRGIQQENIIKPKFIKACPTDNCKGFLNENYYCSICETKVCRKCFAIKSVKDTITEEKHQCKKEDIETAKLIKRDTKNCPSCGVPIHKILGCDQMWCTQCNVAFSWKTGQIENGVIHNPHYYEWMRKQKEGGIRNVGEVVCGGLLNYSQISNIVDFCIGYLPFSSIYDKKNSILSPRFVLHGKTYHCLPFHNQREKLILFENKSNDFGMSLDEELVSFINPIMDNNVKYTLINTNTRTSTFLKNMHRNLLHFQQVILNPLRQKIQTQTNGRLHDQSNFIHRIRYMINEIDEKHFSTLLTKHDNILDKERQILYIYELMASFYSENMNILYNDILDYTFVEKRMFYDTIEYIPRQIKKYIPQNNFHIHITKLDVMKAFCEVIFQFDREYLSHVVYYEIIYNRLEYNSTKSHLRKNYIKHTKLKKLLYSFIQSYILYDDEYNGPDKGNDLNRVMIEYYYMKHGYRDIPCDISLPQEIELSTLFQNNSTEYNNFISSYNDFVNENTLYCNNHDENDIPVINRTLIERLEQQGENISNVSFSFCNPERFKMWTDFLDSKYHYYKNKSTNIYKKVALYCKKKCLLYTAIQAYMKNIYNYDDFIHPFDEKIYSIMKELYDKNPNMNYEYYDFYNYNLQKSNIYVIQKKKNSLLSLNEYSNQTFENEYKREIETGIFGNKYNEEKAKKLFYCLVPTFEKCSIRKMNEFIYQFFHDKSPYYEYMQSRRNTLQRNIIRNMEKRTNFIIHNLDKYTPLECGIHQYQDKKTPYVIYSKQDIMHCIENYYTPLKKINDFIILSNHMRNFCNERLYTISKNYKMRVPYIDYDLSIDNKMLDSKEIQQYRNIQSYDDIPQHIQETYLNDNSKEYSTHLGVIIRNGLILEKKYRIYLDK